jgi:hypothetical protein
MIDTIGYNILRKMKQNRRGKIFFANDFADFGHAKACNKALERLTKQGEIMRVARGIYTIPETSEFFGKTQPSFDSIVKAIIKRDKARIIPTGLYALNVLGLSTQVPMKVVYLTDGAARKLKIGKLVLIFKKTTPKNLSAKGKISSLIIQALKSLGKGKIDEYEEEKIIALLKRENKEHLEYDIKLAPVWIQEIMRKALTSRT